MSAAKDYLFDPARNPLYREDYRPSEYKIPAVDLYISLDDTATVIQSRIKIERNGALGGPLVLDGEDLKLKSLRIIENGQYRDLDPQEYTVTDKNLILKRPPAQAFELEIVTEVNPSENTTLSGIYKAGDIMGSQCEAQGFRRITYFLDRPDNLSVYNVTVEADKAQYPILLSNGNGDYKKPVDLGNGRHTVQWNDPWPKPSYLFALIGGDMKVLEDSYTTMSGKKVDLRIFVQPGYEDKIDWAMESVKRSMKWDEDTYGREYDLDCFHVAALDKFNAGAMENKGLNVFNVSLLVGSPEVSTDDELIDIEAVIGHEYFHNWSGDRVTVRDWFELTLKEGLTVLRDRQFTSDLHSAAIKLIDDATDLRTRQFLEDSGPSAHAIRPDVVEEFDNIYSATVYEKGSHVLGMLKTIIGDDMWRAAMDNYFDRFDGQAVTCDDFIDNMQEVSGVDLTQFRRWYSQSGTPEVSYAGTYDAAAKTYALTLTQKTLETSDQPQSAKQPLYIPIRVGLIGQSGKDAANEVLHLTEATQTFVFKNIEGPVVPSVLRGFSAPVKITTQPSNEELIFRMAHDSDPFNKYEATERLMLKTIQRLIAMHQLGVPLKLERDFLDAYAANLDAALDGDMAFASRTLSLPARNLITQDMATIDIEAIEAATGYLSTTLAETFKDKFADIYNATTAPKGEAYDVSPVQVGRRELHNTALGFLRKLGTPEVKAAAQAQFSQSGNMTEKLAGLGALARMPGNDGAAALEQFYQRYKDNPNVVTKWLSLSAATLKGDVIGGLKQLMKHEAFDITVPNKVRALLAGFVGSQPAAFHATDGSGYKFVADMVIALNGINANTAAGVVKHLTQLKRYDQPRQQLMLKELERIMETPNLGTGVKEFAGRAIDSVKKKPKQSPGADFGKNAPKA